VVRNGEATGGYNPGVSEFRTVESVRACQGRRGGQQYNAGDSHVRKRKTGEGEQRDRKINDIRYCFHVFISFHCS
jgi:hypothetical protein